MVQPEEYGEAARKAIEDGYDAVKVDPIMYDKDGNTYYDRTNIISRAEMKLYRSRMEAIRKEVGDELIIFECHSLPGATLLSK